VRAQRLKAAWVYYDDVIDETPNYDRAGRLCLTAEAWQDALRA